MGSRKQVSRILANFDGFDSVTLNPGSTCPKLKPGVLRLYNMRFCPYAQRTVIALALKNIPVECVNVNLKYKPDWFVAKNPLGKVPMLEIDDTIIFESAVCNEWLDEVYPQSSRLLPADPTAAAKQKMLAEQLAKVSEAMMRVYKYSVTERVLESINKALLKAENLLEDDFYGGNEIGWADVQAWPWFERLATLPTLDMDQYPKLKKYIARMHTVPAVEASCRPVELLRQFSVALMAKEPDYDLGLNLSKL